MDLATDELWRSTRGYSGASGMRAQPAAGAIALALEGTTRTLAGKRVEYLEVGVSS